MFLLFLSKSHMIVVNTQNAKHRNKKCKKASAKELNNYTCFLIILEILILTFR